ncbi:MAG: TlpA family protein disulfide reductase [Myxococcales bacterium]|nr:TlpA family protein disulfide reductase [Myxococcales bacterium]
MPVAPIARSATLFALAGGLLLSLSLAGCALKSDVDALSERIAKIEEAQKNAPKGGSAAPTASTEEEAGATKLMEAIQAAIKANDYPTAKAKLAEISQKYATTRAGKAAARMAPEVNLVGADAKPIEAQKWYTKDEGSFKDRVTLVVFWEVWCPHCKDEMPKMPALLAKYKSQGFGIIGLTKVTKSATDASVEKFIAEHKISFPMGKEIEGGTMSKAYSVSGIPAAALVKDGKVIWRGHPARLTDDLLAQMLAG